MQLSKELVFKMPKTDLHCHLDGSLRFDTLVFLMKKTEGYLATTDLNLLKKKFGFGQIHGNLESYLSCFAPIIEVLQTKDALTQAAFELCEDAFNENVWHLEMRFCPFLNTNLGLSVEEVVLSVLKGINKAKSILPISVGLILCALRNHSPKEAMIIAEIAGNFANEGVVGFDLAGPEKKFPIAPFLPAINLAKKFGLFITLHAGESFGPQGIKEAIFEGGAFRIGHATTLINDDKLLELIADWNIGIEACPTSNLHTKAVESIASHPIKEYLKKGLKVSINTDNRLVSLTNLTKEIRLCSDELDFSIKDLKTILKNGFKSAFLPQEKKNILLKKFEASWCEIQKASSLLLL